MNSKPDRLFASPKAPERFAFNDEVVGVFSDMVRRSVPGYDDTVALTGVVAGQIATEGSRLYDLGCSLGACTLAMRHAVEGRDCEIIGLDNSQAMLDQARIFLDKDTAQTPVKLVLDDIQQHDFYDNVSLAVMNFTLQFVPVEARQALLTRLQNALIPGGALILSEKIRFEDHGTQQRLTDWHHAFKRAQGYSDLEISQKREALENVLIPDTLAEHQARLEKAGFENITLWHQSFTFVSLIAFKPKD